MQLAPILIDEFGRISRNVSLTYSSLDPAVASMTGEGLVSGLAAGFSTLTVQGQGLLEISTITVVGASSGCPGFEVQGLTQDLARRIYLASRTDHTIRRLNTLADILELYAGVENTPGFREMLDSERFLTDPDSWPSTSRLESSASAIPRTM